MSGKILKATIALIGLLAFLFFSTFYTELVPRLLFMAAGELSKGAIQAGETTGSLSRGLDIKGLKVRGQGYSMIVRGILIKMDPLKLFERNVCIDFLGVGTIDVRIEEEKGNQNKKHSPSVTGLPKFCLKFIFKDARVRELSIRTGKNESPFIIKDVELSAFLTGKNFRLKRLRGRLSEYESTFVLDANASVLGKGLGLSAHAVFVRMPRNARKTVIDATLRGDLKRLFITGRMRGVPTGTLRGVFYDILGHPRWRFLVDLKRLNPKDFAHRFPSALIHARAKVRGGDGNVLAFLKGDFTLPRKEKGTFSIKGEWTREGLLVKKGIVSTLGGRLSLTGRLFKDSSFRARADLLDINLGILFPDIKAKVSGAVEASGLLGGKRGPMASVRLKGVQGRLNGRPYLLKGAVVLKAGDIAMNDIYFKGPNTSLFVNGLWKESSQDVKIAFRSTDLSAIYPNVKGQANVKGHIFGGRKDPGVHLYARGRNLSCPQVAFKTLKVALDSAALATSSIKAILHATGVSFREIALTTLHASFKGTRMRHTFRVESQGQGIMADMTISGSLNERLQYTGLLKEINLGSSLSGKWRLVKPARLSIGRNGLGITAVCLSNRQQGGRFCINGEMGKSRMGLELTSSSMPLKPFSTLWGGMASMSGTFDCRLGFHRDGTSSRGSLFLETRDASVFFEEIHRSQPLKLIARGMLSKKRLWANVLARLNRDTELSGNVTLPGFLQGNTRFKKQEIVGRFTLLSNELSMIHEFFPEVFVYDGKLRSKLRFSGTQDNPHLRAKLQLSNVKADYPEYGIMLHVRDASLVLKDQDLQMVALLKSPEGNLAIKGKGRLKPRDLDLLLKVSGRDYRAVTTPYEKVFVSPDLFVFIKNNHIKITGTIIVPRASIQGLSASSSAIVPSPDIKIEGEKDERSRETTKVFLDVNVVLGDGVKVGVYGLEGSIRGRIGLKSSPSGQLLGTGILSIKDGTYSALETRLKIKKGSLLFFSSPLDNPELEIEAVRNVGDSLVGFRINGTLKNPVVKLFSDPPMPESEIARYLLGGKNGTGITKTSVIAGGANLLLSRIRQRLGILNEIKLETGQTSDDLSLMVGTYLRPDLYLKFINDFEDKVTRFILRYDYSKHIEIEAETGESPSAAIFFKLER